MARPQKQGIDYFPVDVTFDDNMNYIIAEHGAEGFGIVIGLFQKIYREGYYTKWDNKILSLFSRKINAKKTTIEKVIETCFDENIFDRNLYEKYKILTSRGIQNRYLKICKDCKRKKISINKNYLLKVNSELMGVITELTGVSEGENSINSGESTQSKVKKRKVKKSKVNNKEITISKINLSDIQKDFIEILKTIDNYPLDIESDIKMYEDLSKKFPALDLQRAIEKFAIYKQDKPLTKNSNARSQIYTSFEKYVEWGECLKQETPNVKKKEVWV
jgi:hypothetical protein